MRVEIKPIPKEMADDVFKVLLKPENRFLIRPVFEALHYPAPWLGWVPMLCEIARDVQKAQKEKINATP